MSAEHPKEKEKGRKNSLESEIVEEQESHREEVAKERQDAFVIFS